ncbi:hypothetical protein O181_063362 [Austropuccinia psidii MF-1]|uniref:START domain-containing protein n=1 Tax=Austropuccinia psidii MF-1 TaxID=1389203 RepID=A0A9Q3I1A5_9BASI|nr:hypothetical protein [Austropuccinia psidii MF-1]
MSSLNHSHQYPLLANLQRHTLFLVSLSLVPLWAFNRFKWNARFTLDQFHLILAQVLFFVLLSRKLRSAAQSPSPSSDTASDHEIHENHPSPGLSPSFRSAQRLKDLVEQSNDWIGIYPTPQLRIMKHRAINSVYTVQMEVEKGTVTLEQLVRCLTERNRWEWDKMCESGQDLGDGIIWLRLKGFWPIKPKELVLRSFVFRLPSSDFPQTKPESPQPLVTILAGSTSTTHPLRSSSLEIKYAGYLIQQLPSGGFKVTHIVDLAGFGPLPTFVTKAILTKFVPSSFRKLIALAQLITPQNSDYNSLSSNWMPLTLDHPGTKPESESDPQTSTEQQRLQVMIKELKDVIQDLRQQQIGKTSWWKKGKILGAVGAALLVFLGTQPNFEPFAVRRRQVRWFYKLH